MFDENINKSQIVFKNFLNVVKHKQYSVGWDSKF